MKKLICGIVAMISMCVCGNNSETDRTDEVKCNIWYTISDNGWTRTRYKIVNIVDHLYIILEREGSHSYNASIVHAEHCPCKNLKNTVDNKN